MSITCPSPLYGLEIYFNLEYSMLSLFYTWPLFIVTIKKIDDFPIEYKKIVLDQHVAKIHPSLVTLWLSLNPLVVNHLQLCHPRWQCSPSVPCLDNQSVDWAWLVCYYCGRATGSSEHSIITCLSWEFIILFDDKMLSSNMYWKQKSLNARLFGF